MKIMFLHGLESGPKGTKARWLSERFGGFTPTIETHDTFEVAVSQARLEVAQYAPDLMVGSSYGGAILVRLLADGVFRGPCVLIAPAAKKLGVPNQLPDGARVTILHGDGDDVVPIEDSVELARTGGKGVDLKIVRGGDHRLNAILADGTLERVMNDLIGVDSR